MRTNDNADCLQRRVRVRAEWRDCRAGVVYLLQKYIETPRILLMFPWVKRGEWETVTLFTDRIQKAKVWAEHYGLEIEYEQGLKHPNDQELSHGADNKKP
jgi:hypothetical protein